MIVNERAVAKVLNRLETAVATSKRLEASSNSFAFATEFTDVMDDAWTVITVLRARAARPTRVVKKP